MYSANVRKVLFSLAARLPMASGGSFVHAMALAICWTVCVGKAVWLGTGQSLLLRQLVHQPPLLSSAVPLGKQLQL